MIIAYIAKTQHLILWSIFFYGRVYLVLRAKEVFRKIKDNFNNILYFLTEKGKKTD